jgi:hypothetical protein
VVYLTTLSVAETWRIINWKRCGGKRWWTNLCPALAWKDWGKPHKRYQVSRSPARDFNPVTPEYEAAAVTNWRDAGLYLLNGPAHGGDQRLLQQTVIMQVRYLVLFVAEETLSALRWTFLSSEVWHHSLGSLKSMRMLQLRNSAGGTGASDCNVCVHFLGINVQVTWIRAKWSSILSTFTATLHMWGLSVLSATCKGRGWTTPASWCKNLNFFVPPLHRFSFFPFSILPSAPFVLPFPFSKPPSLTDIHVLETRSSDRVMMVCHEIWR